MTRAAAADGFGPRLRAFAQTFTRRLPRRVAVTFALLGSATVLTVAAIVFVRGRTLLAAEAEARLRSVAQIKSRIVDSWVVEREADLGVLANDSLLRLGAQAAAAVARHPDLATPAERAQVAAARARLADLGLSYPDFRDIELIAGRGGRVLLSSQRVDEGTYRKSSLYFQQGREGVSTQGVYPSPSTGAPVLTVARPMREAPGAETTIVIAAHVALEALDAIAADHDDLLRDNRVIMLDPFNRIVSAQGFVPLPGTRGANAPAPAVAASGRDSVVRGPALTGTRSFTVYHWVPRLGLVLAVMLDERQAFASVTRLSRTIILAGLLVVALFAAASRQLARRLTLPVSELAAAMDDVARERFGGEAHEAPDDVNSLVASFHRLIARLDQTRRDLETSERRSSTLLANLPGFAYRLSHDAPRRLVFVSEGVTTITERTPADYERGGAASWHDAVVSEEPAELVRRMDAAVAEGQAYELEYRLRAPSGAERWVWERGRGVPDEQGQVRFLEGFVTDITERKELQAQLLHAQKLDSIGHLAGGVAHDFNNLIGIILAACDLILLDTPAQDARRDDLVQIRATAERAAALTGQLLAFSRRQIVQFRLLDLAATIDGIQPLLRRLLGERVALAVVPPTEPFHVRADAAQLGQVLMNLVVNARDAMPKGGTVTVSMREVVVGWEFAEQHGLARAGEHVVLSVTDQGMGMSAETRAHIFEPFFTTKEAGRGTGLGLAVVQGIVRQHGGAIVVDSDVGRGTTFRIYLPRSAAAPAGDPADAGAQARPQGTETVVFVEDDPTLRHLAVRVLSSAGYWVFPAADSHEAMQLLHDHGDDVDLLFTDLVLPDMNGRELAAWCQQHYPRARTLFTSGYTDDEQVLADVRRDLVDFLAKPYGAAELQQKVRDVLDAPAGVRGESAPLSAPAAAASPRGR